MPRLWLAALLAACLPAAEAPDAGRRWWAHVSYLAADSLEGRATGTAAHREAAAYVAARFKEAGLKPSLQPVPLMSRKLDEERSSLRLLRGASAESLAAGEDILLSTRHRPPGHVRAGLVFARNCLRIPSLGVDDFRGMDLRGKVAVCLTGAPAGLPGTIAAHYQSSGQRARVLTHLGAVGFLLIQNPRTSEIPWDRRKAAREVISMSLRGDDRGAGLFSGTLSPARAEKLLEAAGYPLAGILAQAAAGRPLPAFDLKAEIEAEVRYTVSQARSENVLGLLRGSDPEMRNEWVVLTAHLDHLGRGKAIGGDTIYNGAMDNASGVATLIETAAALARSGRRPRRSVLFAAVTGEERGLLGSQYLAAHLPGRAKAAANLNLDMFLPLFPLTRITAIGIEESELRQDVESAAAELRIAVEADPEPHRNRFIRSDQYSFILRGVPSLAFKLGYKKGSAEEQTARKWNTDRYHAPSDDLTQPVDLEAAARFNLLIERLAASVANREHAPRWNPDSFFGKIAAAGEPGSR